MSKVKDFTNGKIFSPLVKFIIPIFAALFLQTMYGAVDLLIVGRFGNSADVSAVSTGSQIMQVITLTITGLAMGITILIGQKLGQGKKKDAGNVVGSGYINICSNSNHLNSCICCICTKCCIIYERSC